MTPADAERFFAALAAVAEIFERELSDAAQTLYFDALADLALEDCLRALGEAAKTKTFMPRPAELRELVGTDGIDPEILAENAWQTYREMADRIGGYASPTFEDAALAAAIIAVFGSWELACWTEFTPEMWVAKRKEFGRVYALKRTVVTDGRRQLVGYCDRDNQERGFSTPVPGVQLALPPQRTRAEWIANREAERAIRETQHLARLEDVNRKVEQARERNPTATPGVWTS